MSSGRSWQWRRWIDLPVTLGLVATAGYVIFTTLRMVVRHAAHVPYWDQWQEILPERYLKTPFAQHNEHRIFVGRLFFALDTWLFGGRSWFCIGGSIAMLAGTAVLIAVAAARGESRRRTLVPVLAFSLSLLLAASAWENLLFGFQASFVAVLPLAVGAFTAFGWGAGKRPLAVAVACAAFAACSLASGVLVAPLLVVFALVVGRPRQHVAVLVCATLLVFAAYLHGYDAPRHHANPATSIERPGMVLRYVAAYLGGPFTWRVEEDRVGLSRIVGYAGLAAWVAVSAYVARHLRREAREWVLPFVMTFAVGTALLTALGRVNFAPSQALESRYASTVFVFWSALAGYFIRRARPPGASAAVAATACGLSVHVALGQARAEGIALARSEPLHPAETALLAGALETATVDRITPAAYLLEEALPELRKRRLSVFHSGWVDWIGKPLDRIVRKRDDAACKGYLDRAFAVPSYVGPAFRVEGWAYSLRDGAPPKRVVLVDQDGIVLGFGLTGERRPDVPAAVSEIHDPLVGFVGHIGALREDSVGVSAVALLDGRVACDLTGVLTIHEADAVRLVRK